MVLLCISIVQHIEVKRALITCLTRRLGRDDEMKKPILGVLMRAECGDRGFAVYKYSHLTNSLLDNHQTR